MLGMDRDTTLLETADATAADTAADTADDTGDDEIVDELLIEEISIDGMCGVY
jgi:mycofactocin precursor